MATAPPDQPNRGPLIAVIVAVAVVVLGLLLYLFVLRGDGDEEFDTGLPTTPTTPTPEASPTPPPDQPDRGDVETFERFGRRDPFKILAFPEQAGGQAPPAAGPGPAEPGAEPGPAEPGEPTEPGRPTGERPEPRGGTTVEGRRVTLVDIFTRNGDQQAQVEVDGTVYTVEPGERFAGNFELVSIQGRCATFLFGDDQFTLCEGQEILK